MATLIEQLVTKMGLRDEPKVLDKTTELLRLLELRAVNVPLQLNEYGKIVLCADIAAELLGIGFDKVQALKLSALRKSHYANHKRMFEKLLDCNKIVGVNDICIQLSLNEVAKKANELYELYANVIASGNADIDMQHPQYAAMAVFQACKLTKRKISKTKLMPFSNLRPTQWQQLEQRWEKFIAKHYRDTVEKLKTQGIFDAATEKADEQRAKSAALSKEHSKTVVEDYEKWKERMLLMAETKLKQEICDAQQMEKENMLLST